jgi:diguanylate cyclase (GGDEF)-like protein
MQGTNPQTVLVIDDSQDIHDLVEVRLGADGLAVLHALDAERGLATLRKKNVDVVLLDLDLEDDNGIDVCRQIVSDPEIGLVPIIFLTGTVDVGTKVKAFDAGAVDYVTKPFDSIELRARVRSALRTKRYHDLLASRARLDGLTGLGNRSDFDERLEQLLAAAKRTKRPMSLVLLDIDHFKKLNDTHGHPFGDAVLQRVAETVRDQLRGNDVACRYGGEEFGVLLGEADHDAGLQIAERIRGAIADLELDRNRVRVPVTASLGVATADSDAVPTSANLIAAADAALYKAKESGRNQVCSAD